MNRTTSTVHASFVVERDYDVPVGRLFAAWADPSTKARWFVAPDGYGRTEHQLDFRIGGRETNRVGPSPDGPGHLFEAHYHDIVPDERIVYSYTMSAGPVRTSVSLATVEFRRTAAGSRLVVTEQGVFLDGHDHAGPREHGTRDLLENLAGELRRTPVPAHEGR